MVDYEKPEDEVEAIWNILNAVQGIEDRLVLILKTHLLIEEILQISIERAVKNPDALHSINFECSEKIALAEAIYGDLLDRWVWKSARQLNRIRNDLAHNIQPKGVEERIDSLCGYVVQESDEDFEEADERFLLNEVLGTLGLKVAALLGRSSPYLAVTDGRFLSRPREEDF